MAQQELTYANLVAGLPDNQAGEITPSDVRNAFATALGGYASFLQAISPTSMLAVGVSPVVVDVWDAIPAKSIDVNAGGSDASLTTEIITVGESGIYFFGFSASFRTGNNNRTVQFQPFVNTVASSVKILQRIGNASDEQTMSFVGTVALLKDDELDMRASVPSGGATDLIFNSSSFSIFRVG